MMSLSNGSLFFKALAASNMDTTAEPSSAAPVVCGHES